MPPELKAAYEKLVEASRNVLELSEQAQDGDYYMDPENYEDLAEALLQVHRAS